MRIERSFLICLFLVVSNSVQVASQPADTLEYSILARGKYIGFVKGWRLSDGKFQDFTWINDRGRGDSMYCLYEFGSRSIPVSIDIRGHDYFKNQVVETFALRNDTAHWVNESEDEMVSVSKPAYYLPLKAPYFSFSRNLLRALKVAGGSLDLLPSGTAHLEIAETLRINSVEAHLCRITGINFTPSYLWADSNLLEIAYLDEWVQIIRKGIEEWKSELWEIQKKEQERFYSSIANELTERPKSILINSVSLFDSRNATVRPSMNVLISGGLIQDVSQDSIEKPEGARTISGNGMMLLPGLIDMHSHPIAHSDGLFNIACGVTSIRNIGGDLNAIKYKQDVDSGKAIGPTVEWISGLIDGSGPLAAPTMALADSLPQALAWVDSFAKAGYSGIKIYSSIHPEWVEPMAKRAKSYGMRVSGHIPAFMTAEQAIKLGYEEIHHENMLFLSFYGDTIDTRSPLRFTIPARRAAFFDFASKELGGLITLMKSRKVTVDPTLCVFEALFTARPMKIHPFYRPYYEYLPPAVQRYVKAGGGGLPVTPETDTIYQKSFQSFLELLKRLYDEKISIVAGTDGEAGLVLQRELELYVKAGIPANEVLRIATIHAAGILKKEKEIGSIEKGKRANMFLVDGNPTKNISDLRKVTYVIKDGNLYQSKRLFRALSFSY